MFPLPGVPLAKYQPAWLAVGEDREQMGVEFDCPTGHPHRIQLWFENPGDAGPPATPEERGWGWQRRRLYAYGEELDHLTVACPDNEAIDLRGCGAYWLVDGCLYERLFRGIG